jgi:hypothetical protein
MKPLQIDSCDQVATPGDFAAAIDQANCVLLLPREVAQKFVSHGIRTATDLISYLQTFPSASADDLQWSIADVTRGLERLKEQLRGHVDDAILNPPARADHGYGGRNPADLKRRSD